MFVMIFTYPLSCLTRPYVVVIFCHRIVVVIILVPNPLIELRLLRSSELSRSSGLSWSSELFGSAELSWSSELPWSSELSWSSEPSSSFELSEL